MPTTVTLPLIDVTLSVSTLVALVLLLVLFFTFFSVSVNIGGSLSPKNVASELNPCDADPDVLDTTTGDVLSGLRDELGEAILDVEKTFVNSVETVAQSFGDQPSGAA